MSCQVLNTLWFNGYASLCPDFYGTHRRFLTPTRQIGTVLEFKHTIGGGVTPPYLGMLAGWLVVESSLVRDLNGNEMRVRVR